MDPKAAYRERGCCQPAHDDPGPCPSRCSGGCAQASGFLR